MTLKEAREIVRRCIRKQGVRLSNVKSSDITYLAKDLMNRPLLDPRVRGMLGSIRRYGLK